MLGEGVTDAFIEKVLSTPPYQIWYPTTEEMLAGKVITRVDDPVKLLAANYVGLIQSLTNHSPFILKPTGHQEIDQVMLLTSHFLTNWNSGLTEMDAELEKVGEPNIYSDEILNSEVRIQEAISIIRDRQTIFEAHLKLSDQQISDFAKDLQSINLSESSSSGFIKAHTDGIVDGQKTSQEVMRLRHDVTSNQIKFLEYMANIFGKYTLKGTKISFTDKSEGPQYNRLSLAVDEAQENLSQYSVKLQTDSSNGIKKLKEMEK
jgi:hypothetical protein